MNVNYVNRATLDAVQQQLLQQAAQNNAAITMDQQFGGTGGTDLWMTKEGTIPHDIHVVVKNKGNGNYLTLLNSNGFIHTSGALFNIVKDLPVGTELVVSALKQVPIPGINESILASIEKSLERGSLRNYREMLHSGKYREHASTIKLALAPVQSAQVPDTQSTPSMV